MKALSLLLILLVTTACSVSRVIEEQGKFADLCSLHVVAGAWHGRYIADADKFESMIAKLKDLEFTQDGVNATDLKKTPPLELPLVLKDLSIRTALKKEKDIGWEDHEMWRAELTVFSPKSLKNFIGPVQASVVRESKRKYLQMESVPVLKVTQDLSGMPVTFHLSCNNF